MNEPLLRRFWFEFELAPVESPGHGVSLDGGTQAQRLLWRGCGVTGYDEEDCLAQIGELLGGEPLPSITRAIADVDISSLEHELEPRLLGVPVWRGLWYPRQLYHVDS